MEKEIVKNLPASGRKLRRLREARGISMIEMSRATGIGYASISAFERGGKGAISAEKADVLYSYLESLPIVRTPLVTEPGRYSKKRKHRRASVAKQTTASPVKETPQPAEEKPVEQNPVEQKPIEQTEQKSEKPEALKCKQIHFLHDLIQAANIRAFSECRHLIAEIDNKETPDVIRTVDVQHLVTLVNFLKENWGCLG